MSAEIDPTRLAGAGEKPVVLASGSRTRAEMLRAAGLPVEIRKPSVDESEFKRSLRAEGASAAEVATFLAEMKANTISRARPEALVIGADQMLDLEGSWFDKPETRDGAADHLRKLSGKRHTLISSVVVSAGGTRIWHHVATASLLVRPLSEDFISAYLDAIGDRALDSVGAYQLESVGAQLFTSVEGDFFTVLGLPLLPLLDFMRTHGALRV
ncbi:Maf family protein [Nisaea acidiphila]|uniref:Nucleoside triphosphate pyrophosphatase n=1 Tax=Nisaea acidiphila TaxID=1862145 RepID=A0A9J7AYN9_9PROT|nr:Maf family protein [Nisaea acidiphila]UUX52190.1 Maf family protein [Nisaea acidiphila]